MMWNVSADRLRNERKTKKGVTSMDVKEKAFAWVDANKEGIIDLWKQMVSIDSGIGVKEGGMEIGNPCAGILEELGFTIRRYHSMAAKLPNVPLPLKMAKLTDPAYWI